MLVRHIRYSLKRDLLDRFVGVLNENGVRVHWYDQENASGNDSKIMWVIDQFCFVKHHVSRWHTVLCVAKLCIKTTFVSRLCFSKLFPDMYNVGFQLFLEALFFEFASFGFGLHFFCCFSCDQHKSRCFFAYHKYLIFGGCLFLSGKFSGNNAERFVALDIFNFSSSVTLHTFSNMMSRSNKDQFLPCRFNGKHSLTKRKSPHALRRSNFKRNTFLTFRTFSICPFRWSLFLKMPKSSNYQTIGQLYGTCLRVNISCKLIIIITPEYGSYSRSIRIQERSRFMLVV